MIQKLRSDLLKATLTKHYSTFYWLASNALAISARCSPMAQATLDLYGTDTHGGLGSRVLVVDFTPCEALVEQHRQIKQWRQARDSDLASDSLHRLTAGRALSAERVPFSRRSAARRYPAW